MIMQKNSLSRKARPAEEKRKARREKERCWKLS